MGPLGWKILKNIMKTVVVVVVVVVVVTSALPQLVRLGRKTR